MLLVVNTVFAALNCLYTFVKEQLTLFVWVNFWILYYISLMYLSIFFSIVKGLNSLSIPLVIIMFLFRFHSSIEGDSDSFWQLTYYFSVEMKFLRFYSTIFGDGNVSSFDSQADIFLGEEWSLKARGLYWTYITYLIRDVFIVKVLKKSMPKRLVLTLKSFILDCNPSNVHFSLLTKIFICTKNIYYVTGEICIVFPEKLWQHKLN